MCTSFGEWESWPGYMICSLTDFTLVFLGKTKFRFSFAIVAQSRQVLGACRSAGGGGADFGEWLRPFGMKIWNAGSCPYTCWMPHLQSAPEPHSDTKTRLKTDGTPFKRVQQHRELPVMLVEHHCKLYLAIPVLVRRNVLDIFLQVQWVGLLKILLGVLRESDFLINFSCELSS